jgi:phosphonate transport system substrate-binding protein
MIHKYIIILVITVFYVPSWEAYAESTSAASRQTLVFGFLPILSAERLVTRFSPLVDYLSEHTGLDIRMETAPDFAEFIRRTQRERRYDILFTAPHFFYLAEHQRGYRGLVRVNRSGMRAIVVVPANSDINALADLRGRSLATTGPLALSTLLIRNLLLQSGLDPDKDLRLVPTPSHIAALLSSDQGNTDASAVMQPVFRRVRPQIKDNMRIIATSEAVPHIPLGVAPWIDERTANRLQQALIGMQYDPAGRRVLKHLDWPGFVPIKGQEYERLRQLADQVKLD